jgi:hypothetical protein
MGCGCGKSSYTRPTATAQSQSQHAPQVRVVSAAPRVNHAPSQQPKVIQAAALSTRQQAAARRQI